MLDTVEGVLGMARTDQLVELGLDGGASRFCVFWNRNTITTVMIVVPVLMTSCQVSRRGKNGFERRGGSVPFSGTSLCFSLCPIGELI